MNVFRFIGAAWHRLWFARFDPLCMSVYRVSLGLLLIVYFIANFPNWERFYSADGILSLDTVDPQRQNADWVTLFYWTEGYIPDMVFWVLGFIASIFFTIGFQTRICTIFLYVLIASMVHRNRMIVNGEDLTFRMVLLYSCFAPLNHVFSVDSWLRRRKAERKGLSADRPQPMIWAVRLIQINVALIYVISLPNKLYDDPDAWLWEGSAIYLAMTSNMWSRWPWPEMFYGGFLSKLFTYGTVVVEGLFPILVWFKRPKLFAVAAIASLHLGIAVMLQNVTFFTLAMVCAFWVYVPSDSIRSGYAFIRRYLPLPGAREISPEELSHEASSAATE